MIRHSVELRTGRTWYVTLGDAPWIVLLGLTLAASWVLTLADRVAASPRPRFVEPAPSIRWTPTTDAAVSGR